MTENNKTTTARRVFVSVALIALLGVFLALYYFVYIPQQETFYNKGTFRVLNQIADNFTDRLMGNNIAAKNANKKDTIQYLPLQLSDTTYDSLNIRHKLSNIEGKPQNSDTAFLVSNTLTESYGDTPGADSARKKIAKIFEPIISVHGNTFESVVFIHLEKTKNDKSNNGRLIYNSSGLTIDEEINIDSLFKKTSAFIFPIVNDISLEAQDYKLFLFPFRIQHEKFLLGGFISKSDFKSHTHNFPVISLVILGILLISVLLSLPFLKIFLIGPQEHISAHDVRSVIAMVYVIPFFLVLLGSCIWLQYTNSLKSDANLETLNDQVKNNFYKEIQQAITQLKDYDLIYNNTKEGFKNMTAPVNESAVKNGSIGSFTDAYFHPRFYKNMDGVFWVDKNGDEIAKWNFTKSLPAFYNKNDRDYFQAIKNNLGYKISGDTTPFSIQPSLAKSTGDYTISIAIKSTSAFSTGKAILIGLYGKMYSVYKPVVPRGLNFCIIKDDGRIFYHSESDRSLQENLFDELDNSDAIKTAISHKENLLLDNVELYDNKVKLLIKPMDGLPYYMVTYSTDKVTLLYIIHIIAFSFFCESMLLLVVAFLTLLYYHSGAKFSKLFFAENNLNFAKPTPLKTEYYKKILYYQLAVFVLMGIAFIFFNGKVYLSYILYTSILLPLFSVIGYYLIRAVENYKDYIEAKNNTLTRQRSEGYPAMHTSLETSDSTGSEENYKLSEDLNSFQNNTESNFQKIRELFSNRRFLKTFIKIIVPYLVLIWCFFILKSKVSYTPFSTGKTIVNILVFFFATGFPLMAILISLLGLPKWLMIKNKLPKEEHNYLRYFVMAIMVSAMLTSVMPTLGFILFAAGQEKSLQLKAQQIFLSNKLVQHRLYINQKIATTKFKVSGNGNFDDKLYLDSLKFSASKGIYPAGKIIQPDQHSWSYNKQDVFSNSNFYKQITQYLFLPTEHSDYFDNATDSYYWMATPLQRDKQDSLLFHYKNSDDNINTSDVTISASLPLQPSFLSILNYHIGIIILLAAVGLLLLFYNIIYSASMRIFLINYFDKTPGAEQDSLYLDKFFVNEDLTEKPFDRDFWGQDKLTLLLIKTKENVYPSTTQREESILKIQTLIAPVYETIWKDLTPIEQFVLYDFAEDGFSNYKNVDVLYSLYKKGILKKEDNSFIIVTKSFRNYIISKTGTAEINKLKREISAGGTWGNLRTVLLIIIFLIVVFLFIVQEDLSKRVFAIVTSVGAAIPLILKLFDRNLAGSGNSTDNTKK